MKAAKLELEILHLEAELNNLWAELNTITLSHILRVELEKKLGGLEEQFKAVMSGQAPQKEFEAQIREIDYQMAEGALLQAEQEISKADHHGRSFLALQNVKKDLENKRMTPFAARHEIKAIMRHH